MKLQNFLNHLLSILNIIVKCNLCGNEFFGGTPQQQEAMLRDHIKSVHSKARLDNYQIPQSTINDMEQAKTTELPSLPVQPLQPVKKELPPPIPIALHYKYMGQCPECRLEIDTMEFMVADRLYMVAFCPLCKKKRMEKSVIPISEMTESKYVVNKSDEIALDEDSPFPITKFKKKK